MVTSQHTAWLFIILGILFLLGNKLPFIGHLPGDFNLRVTENITVFFPLGTCLLASLIFSVVMRLFFSK